MAWARILLLFEAFAGGTLRPDFETILRQALYRRYVGPRPLAACAKVFLAGANLFLSFFFLFNGFRKRRFESFCGGGFAWLGPESCCFSRLSQAVLQGQISRRF